MASIRCLCQGVLLNSLLQFWSSAVGRAAACLHWHWSSRQLFCLRALPASCWSVSILVRLHPCWLLVVFPATPYLLDPHRRGTVPCWRAPCWHAADLECCRALMLSCCLAYFSTIFLSFCLAAWHICLLSSCPAVFLFCCPVHLVALPSLSGVPALPSSSFHHRCLVVGVRSFMWLVCHCWARDVVAVGRSVLVGGPSMPSHSYGRVDSDSAPRFSCTVHLSRRYPSVMLMPFFYRSG